VRTTPSDGVVTLGATKTVVSTHPVEDRAGDPIRGWHCAGESFDGEEDGNGSVTSISD